jgi:hypothetical protein
MYQVVFSHVQDLNIVSLNSGVENAFLYIGWIVRMLTLTFIVFAINPTSQRYPKRSVDEGIPAVTTTPWNDCLTMSNNNRQRKFPEIFNIYMKG